MKDLHRDVAIDSLLERAVHAPHRADAGELAHLDVPGKLATDVCVAPPSRIARALGGLRRRSVLERGAVVRAEECVGRIAGPARRTELGGGRRGDHGDIVAEG